MPAGKWQFWIDRGGTFTDIVARDPDGRLSACAAERKPRRYRVAAIAGIKTSSSVPRRATRPAWWRRSMGTTVATNALLERKGEARCWW
jgi:5-oxoprolinase (ATP-hydrolysing)